MSIHDGTDVEECALALAEKLPEMIRKYALESAYVTCRVPLWALILGHIMRAYENGLMVSPILDPSWSKAIADNPIPEHQREAECEHCHKVFMRKYFGMRYC